MKIKTPTEFLAFNSGLCDIYSTKGNQRAEKLMTLCFGDRTVGFKRHYEARATSTEINRLIQVPLQPSISTTNRAVIGGNEYKIDFAQNLYDTNPPASVLTLKKIG